MSSDTNNQLLSARLFHSRYNFPSATSHVFLHGNYSRGGVSESTCLRPDFIQSLTQDFMKDPAGADSRHPFSAEMGLNEHHPPSEAATSQNRGVVTQTRGVGTQTRGVVNWLLPSMVQVGDQRENEARLRIALGLKLSSQQEALGFNSYRYIS